MRNISGKRFGYLVINAFVLDVIAIVFIYFEGAEQSNRHQGHIIKARIPEKGEKT